MVNIHRVTVCLECGGRLIARGGLFFKKIASKGTHFFWIIGYFFTLFNRKKAAQHLIWGV